MKRRGNEGPAHLARAAQQPNSPAGVGGGQGSDRRLSERGYAYALGKAGLHGCTSLSNRWRERVQLASVPGPEQPLSSRRPSPISILSIAHSSPDHGLHHRDTTWTSTAALGPSFVSPRFLYLSFSSSCRRGRSCREIPPLQHSRRGPLPATNPVPLAGCSPVAQVPRAHPNAIANVNIKSQDAPCHSSVRTCCYNCTAGVWSRLPPLPTPPLPELCNLAHHRLQPSPRLSNHFTLVFYLPGSSSAP